MACIQAAGCDLAIKHSGFMAIVDKSGTSMMVTLLGMFLRAKREFSKGPEAEGLLALMDVQMTRTLAACLPVWNPSPVYCKLACKLTLLVPREACCSSRQRMPECATACAAVVSLGHRCQCRLARLKP